MDLKEKQLLLADICARLPYGFTVHRYSDNSDIIFEPNEIDGFAHFLEYSEGEDFKPYLRPMSSMTGEERKEYNDIVKNTIDFYNCPKSEEICFFITPIDWLNKNMFDYRGLISLGLGLEAPKGMYGI